MEARGSDPVDRLQHRLSGLHPRLRQFLALVRGLVRREVRRLGFRDQSELLKKNALAAIKIESRQYRRTGP